VLVPQPLRGRVNLEAWGDVLSYLTACQVFMTRSDTLNCVHEPFGDAFYFGPERLSSRFEDDAKAREDSGFSNATFQTIFEQIDQKESEVWFFPCREISPSLVHCSHILFTSTTTFGP
jgi:hypothetical protein